VVTAVLLKKLGACKTFSIICLMAALSATVLHLQVAAVSLSALVMGMHNQGVCAVARYVYRKGTNPKLVALHPRVKPDYQCLVMAALPFSEDAR